jgi:hypothetical protein
MTVKKTKYKQKNERKNRFTGPAETSSFGPLLSIHRDTVSAIPLLILSAGVLATQE